MKVVRLKSPKMANGGDEELEHTRRSRPAYNCRTLGAQRIVAIGNGNSSHDRLDVTKPPVYQSSPPKFDVVQLC